MEFRRFLTEGKKGEDDVKKTLGRIPKSHRELVKGYKFKFQPSNTLKGDRGHIGFIDEENKTITIASPWNYGREFTLLHEIGHAVWKYRLDDGDRKRWKDAVKEAKKSNREGLDQNEEETFCMAYAQAYAKNKMVKYDHEGLVEFARKVR